MDYKKRIYDGIMKKEFNKEPFNYNNDVVIYSNVSGEARCYNSVSKAIEIEKYVFGNNKYTFTINKPTFYTISEYVVSCYYTIDYYSKDIKIDDKASLISKFTIKDVNMEKLLSDLNKSGMDVDRLLKEFMKPGCNLDHIVEYFKKHNIEITSVMLILNKNGVTIANLLKNEFVYDVIKSSSYAWMCGGNERPPGSKKTTVKKISAYVIYNIKKNDEIISINWSTYKI
jgi:hypothetical protein